LATSYTRTRPRRTIVTVREQLSSVVQSVPIAAARLYFPLTAHLPRRRLVFTRSRRPGD
jgi:hypothetical protein